MKSDHLRSIAIVAHPHCDRVAAKVRHLAGWLAEREIEMRLAPDFAVAMGMPDKAHEVAELAQGADLLLALGGDGTFLGAARMAAPLGIPILGVDLGNLGFLTDVRVDAMEEALQAFADGQYTIDERTMLQAGFPDGGEKSFCYDALNDVVIAKGSFSRMIHLRVFIEGRYLASYAADGIILSTPTGSTAYSLSAGGPVVNPVLKAIIITPICPHTLYARSLVVSEDEEIRVTLESEHGQAMITLDGQEGAALADQDTVIIRRAPYRAHVVKLHERSFYTVLRNKLKWGGGGHNEQGCSGG